MGRFNWDLHSAGGFWVSLPLAIEALTGVFLCFGVGWLLVLLGGRRTDFDDLVASPPVAAHCAVSAQHIGPALAEAAVLHPDAADMFVMLPSPGTAGLAVFRRTARDLQFGNTTVTTFDTCTGRVVKDVDSEQAGLPLRTVLFLDAFHFGLVGGALLRPVWILLGCTPGILFVTGLWMWWRRRGRHVAATEHSLQHSGCEV